MNNQNPQSALARKHLDRRLGSLRDSAAHAKPPKGWLRAMRDALGMTTRQFAQRLGVSQPTAFNLEQSEMRETISLKRLREAAEALDCTLVYALVPRKPLSELVEDRARALADAQLARLHHTMSLEDQALSPQDLGAERERLTRAFLEASPRRLWEEP